jgi:hypothetical protein
MAMSVECGHGHSAETPSFEKLNSNPRFGGKLLKS